MARGVALMRAAHQILDDPVIFNDPIAHVILGITGDSTFHTKQAKIWANRSR